ncbi:MAG: RibD family protein [Proteobacteria bacterium]|nr:MAG: RibD family protein [Pseudomonadota bacterium]
MKRPYVICHMTTTVDGKIQPNLWPKGSNIHQLYEKCHNKLKGDGWIIGRTSMQGYASKKHKTLGKSDPKIKKVDYIGDGAASSFAIVIDKLGKCRWDSNEITGDHIVEILTEQVPTNYLKHLQEKRVSYIFAGKTEIDLEMSLMKLREHFGIKRLLLEGGGLINGTFLKANIIDELSQLVMPLADGSIGSSTMFDAEEGYTSRPATQMKLKSVTKLSGGVVWLRYRIKK